MTGATRTPSTSRPRTTTRTPRTTTLSPSQITPGNAPKHQRPGLKPGQVKKHR